MNATKALFGILTITAGLAMQVHAQNWVTNDLVVYYPFSGNANDASGHGNNGTVNRAALTADRFGNANSAYYFDGASSDILVPETLFGATDAAWTISLWITFDGGPYWDLMAVYSKSCLNGEMSLVIHSNEVRVAIHNPSKGWIWTGAPLLTNSTMHVVGVYRKGQSLSLYIDGVLRNSVPVPNENLWLQAFPVISALGAYHYTPGPYNWFRGTLDDFRVYTRALSPSEVQELYAYESVVPPCVSPSAGLISWWPAEGNANDTVDGNSGVLVNGVTFAPGKVGQAFSFNGTSSYIRIADNPNLHFATAMTIEAWIYPTSLGAYQGVVSKWAWPGGSMQNYNVSVRPAGQVGLSVCPGGNCWEDTNVVSTTSLPLNQWTHFAATYDGSVFRIYVNGLFENQTPYSNGIFPGAGDLILGASVVTGGEVLNPFGGRIDEPAVYNRALSTAEIQAIYNAGSAGKCVQPPNCIPPPSGLVSWWPGQDNANDIAGTNNGTLLNGATLVPGKVGQAFNFDGIDDYVQVPDAPNLRFTNCMTVETWIYARAVGGHHREILSKWGDYGADQRSYTMNIDPTGVIGFAIDSDGGPVISGLVLGTTTVPINEWVHTAVVYDGSSLTIYLNGIPDGNSPFTNVIFPGTAALTIGWATWTSSYFDGLIDEPAVYNRALSAAEIQAIYDAGSAGKCFGPSISAQPRSQVGYWGRSVTFSVTAVTNTPLSYQWLHNGTPIEGATGASLILTNLQATNAGNYSVVITNDYGSITSSNAYLTVNPAGVSLALYSGITIEGVVGLTYGIQYSTDLSNTNDWQGMANVTLSAPTELWFDMQPANQLQRYYRVLPGPITIP